MLWLRATAPLHCYCTTQTASELHGSVTQSGAWATGIFVACSHVIRDVYLDPGVTTSSACLPTAACASRERAPLHCSGNRETSHQRPHRIQYCLFLCQLLHIDKLHAFPVNPAKRNACAPFTGRKMCQSLLQSCGRSKSLSHNLYFIWWLFANCSWRLIEYSSIYFERRHREKQFLTFVHLWLGVLYFKWKTSLRVWKHKLPSEKSCFRSLRPLMTK